MNQELRILLLEDRVADAELVGQALRKDCLSFRLERVDTEADFIAKLHDFDPSLVLADYSLPGYNGLAALEAVLKQCPDIPFIFVSGTLGEETAIEALHCGATDYVLKHRLSRLGLAVRRALREREERSKRKHAETVLAARDRNYREIFNATAEAILVHDADTGVILDANQATLEMFGYSHAELLAMTGEKLWASGPGIYRQALPQISSIKEPAPQHFECLCKRKNGGYFWSEVVLRSTQIDGKQRVIDVVRDITPRKRAEQALRESEAQMGTVFDSLTEGLVVSSLDGQVLQWNRAALQMHGISDADAGRKSLIDYADIFELTTLDNRVVPQSQWPLRRLFRGEPVQDLELKFRRTDKSWERVYKYTGALVRDVDQRPIQALLTISDITERKRAEDQLRMLSRMVEQSPVSIVITDLEGCIEYINPKCAQVTGYTLEELHGKKPNVFKSGEVPQEVYQELWQTILAGKEWRGEFHNKKKNGELFWEKASISPIADDSGRITHYLGVKEDITQRKQLEAQFLQAQKMEAVGQLAGGVAHDFNNILAATMMHLELVRMEHQLAPEILSALSELQQELQRAANLTRQLLVFSRRQSMRSAPLELNELVEGLLKMLKRLLGENIDVQFQRSPQALWVEADTGMIEQVIMNLCVNARDAMAKGGRLTLATQLIEVAPDAKQLAPQARPGQFVTLKVSDTGCGMSAATIKRIFEPFFTTKEAGKGTGLGLATVFGIVKQHDGWITVESAPGQGSTFQIFIPTVKATKKESPTPASKPHGGSETILLVEDEANVRRLLKMSLSLCGYEVLDAANGMEAIETWKKHSQRIRLLITDMVMPEGLTGLDLAERLRQTHEQLKVLVMTGYSPELIQPAQPQPDISFLAKPFDLTDLLKTIRETLDAPPAPGARSLPANEAVC